MRKSHSQQCHGLYKRQSHQRRYRPERHHRFNRGRSFWRQGWRKRSQPLDRAATAAFGGTPMFRWNDSNLL